MDVYWFSHLVNTGMLEVNARLTDDVDMSSIENFPSIGNKKYQYKGTFDGQHHTVSNLHMEYELDYTGFLGAVAGGAALKNITFDSSCTIIGKNYTGAVGGFYDGMSGDITISNVGFEGEVAGTKKYAAGIIGNVTCLTNADEVRMYKNDKYVATFHSDPAFSALPHGPVTIDDTVGALLETEEGFSGEKARVIRKCMNIIRLKGLAGLSTADKALFGYAMVRFRLKYEDLVRLYGLYIGNWADRPPPGALMPSQTVKWSLP